MNSNDLDMHAKPENAQQPHDEGGVALSPIVRLKKILGDAQSADITALKTQSIIERGCYRGNYCITGFVLCNEIGDRCIIESSAVRWLDKDEMWWLMHDSQSPINPTNGARLTDPPAATDPEGPGATPAGRSAGSVQRVVGPPRRGSE